MDNYEGWGYSNRREEMSGWEMFFMFACFFPPSTAMAAQWQYHVLINCSDLYNKVLPSCMSVVNSSMKNLWQLFCFQWFCFRVRSSSHTILLSRHLNRVLNRQAIQRGVHACVYECGEWVFTVDRQLDNVSHCDTAKRESAGEERTESEKEKANLTDLKSKGAKITKTALPPPSGLHHLHFLSTCLSMYQKITHKQLKNAIYAITIWFKCDCWRE